VEGCALYEVTGEGWSEQVQTVGKNLLKPTARTVSSSGVTYSVDSNGRITLSGTATANDGFTIYSSYGNLADGAYTVSLFGNDKAMVNGSESDSFTITGGTGSKMMNITVTNGTVYSESLYAQIEADLQDTSYEPYSGGQASPRPDWPQPIEVCRGRNLAEPLNYGSVSDGYVNYTGVSGTQFAKAITLDAGTYTASLRLKTKPSSSHTLNIYKDSESSGNVIAGFENINGYNLNQLYSVTFTLAERAPVLFYQWAGSTEAFSAQFQLEAGSQATPYVPYGNVGIEVQSRNLLKFPYLTMGSHTSYGVARTVNADGTVQLSGTATLAYTIVLEAVSSSTYGAASNAVDVFDGPGTYTLSSGSTQANVTMNHYRNGTLLAQRVSPATFEVLEGDTAEVGIAVNNGASYDTLVKPQLEKAPAATEFKPYFNRFTVPIPLPLKSDGTRWAGGLPDGTADALTVDSAGKWEWVNACEEVVFDGDENWECQVSGSLDNTFSLRNSDLRVLHPNNNGSGRPNEPLLSSRQIAPSTVPANTEADRLCRIFGICGDNGSFRGFCVGKNEAGQTLADWKTWLASNNITVLYPLATPATESGYVVLPLLPNGCTVTCPELAEVGVQWVVEGLRPVMQRILDERAYIESLIAELATA